MWSSQLSWKSIMYALSMSSKIWFTLSVWPSVCGWKILLNDNWLPKASWKLLQKWDVKTEPRSDTIVSRTPCNLIISWMKILAYISAVWVILTGKKCADLVNLSTITQIESFPSFDLGNPIMKSMEISAHFHSGMGKSCRVPACLWCSALICWQV